MKKKKSVEGMMHQLVSSPHFSNVPEKIVIIQYTEVYDLDQHC